MAQYSKVQLIAYHVPTDKSLKAGNACSITKASADIINPYLEKMSSDDARNRLRRMVAVVEKAETSTDLGDKSTLKVFMAPEFYFQPFVSADYNDPAKVKELPPRRYSESDKNLIVSALFWLFAEKRWTDWLFVFGTIIWEAEAKKFLDDLATIIDRKKAVDSDYDSTQANTDPLLVLKNDKISMESLASAKDRPVVFNTAILITGGFGVLTVNKKNYSDYDKILKNYRPTTDNDAYNSLPFKEKTAIRNYLDALAKLDPKNSLTSVADNLNATVEICKDHDDGVVEFAYGRFKASWGNDNVPVIDIQLLTCCGMQFQLRNVVVPKDRFALRCDGSSDEGSSSEVLVVTGFELDKNKRQIPTVKSTVKPKSAIALEGDLALDLTGLTATNKDAQTVDLKTVFKQELFMYAPMAIAPLNRNNNNPLQKQVVPQNQVVTK